MNIYSVRSVLLWNTPGRETKNVYEERVTMWNAESLDKAIELAESETKKYANNKGFEELGFYQGFSIFDKPETIPQGLEVFSLLRDSDLPIDDYLDQFFDTGNEHQANIIEN